MKISLILLQGMLIYSGEVAGEKIFLRGLYRLSDHFKYDEEGYHVTEGKCRIPSIFVPVNEVLMRRSWKVDVCAAYPIEVVCFVHSYVPALNRFFAINNHHLGIYQVIYFEVSSLPSVSCLFPLRLLFV